MGDDSNRRDFLKAAAASLLIAFTHEDLIKAAVIQDTPPVSPAVKFGVIGLGQWGREILTALARSKSAEVVAVCDTYEPATKKALEVAPKATAVADYRKLLETADVEVVVVATPTYTHREIALAALQAGKHVYCEAPLATTVDDAKAIAAAAAAAPKLKFVSGLQGRSNPLYLHISKFVRSGVLGTPAQVTGQWNKRQSWKRLAPTPEREAALNWRLSSKTSSGIVGEQGVHHIDLAIWLLKAPPTAASGMGSIMAWKDGRDVPDTLQSIIEFPSDVHMVFSSTLASSFSDSYTLFQGSNSSLMMRENAGWLIKESDSPLLGWEVYARKEPVHNETGIALVADASKILAAGGKPSEKDPNTAVQDSLYHALDDFARAVRTDAKPVAGLKEGFEATVAAIKVNEAVVAGSRLTFDKTLFELT